MEYIRGEGVLVAQNLAGMLSVLKAVSPGGGWEWQYIPNLFSPSASTLERALEIMAGMIDTLQVNKDVMARRALEGYGTATELADEIVRRTGLSFRDSHHIVGMTTRMAIQSGKLANEITPEMVDDAAEEVIGRRLDLDVQVIKSALDPVEDVRIRNIPGGPAPEEVERMIQNRKGDLEQERRRFENRQKLLEQSAIKLAQTVKVS
ncbi:MAG: hypothetical protein JXA42_09700, partial [Anaerolineales bacterium]|nr:hypothetical protein [Anaerolineales bacterium]